MNAAVKERLAARLRSVENTPTGVPALALYILTLCTPSDGGTDPSALAHDIASTWLSVLESSVGGHVHTLLNVANDALQRGPSHARSAALTRALAYHLPRAFTHASRVDATHAASRVRLIDIWASRGVFACLDSNQLTPDTVQVACDASRLLDACRNAGGVTPTPTAPPYEAWGLELLSSPLSQALNDAYRRGVATNACTFRLGGLPHAILAGVARDPTPVTVSSCFHVASSAVSLSTTNAAKRPYILSRFAAEVKANEDALLAAGEEVQRVHAALAALQALSESGKRVRTRGVGGWDASQTGGRLTEDDESEASLLQSLMADDWDALAVKDAQQIEHVAQAAGSGAAVAGVKRGRASEVAEDAQAGAVGDASADQGTSAGAAASSSVGSTPTARKVARREAVTGASYLSFGAGAADASGEEEEAVKRAEGEVAFHFDPSALVWDVRTQSYVSKEEQEGAGGGATESWRDH